MSSAYIGSTAMCAPSATSPARKCSTPSPKKNLIWTTDMKQITDRDFERTNLLLAFTGGACAMALAVMLILTFSGRLFCN